MQIKNWNDLTTILALKRGGSYSAAAKILKVDDTTVSRRIAALQNELKTRLFIRRPDGSLQMTDTGEAILPYLDSIENNIGLIEETLAATHTDCVGTVRITSVPVVVNRMLAPRVNRLFDQHPRLSVVLIPDGRDLSLSYRETDLAVRLARPEQGGSFVKARKIGRLSYSVYVAKRVSRQQALKLPWVSYDDLLAHTPTAEWTNFAEANEVTGTSCLKVQDAETAIQATLCGSFRSLLPDAVVQGEEGLVRLPFKSQKSPPSRDLWLIGHADQMEMRRIIAASEWIEATIREFMK